MKTIKLTCDCGHVYPKMERDEDAPEAATSMGCNWCPMCEDTAEDYYQEWYNFDDNGEAKSDDPNQLMMFSIADDVLENHKTNNQSLTLKAL